MPRPRKDGRPPAKPVRLGRTRVTEDGKQWQVTAYAPTPSAPHGRVMLRHPDTGLPTSRTPKEGRSLEETFEDIERDLDRGVALDEYTDVRAEDGTANRARRDVRALGALYVEHLELKGLSAGYIANRRSLLRAWVYPFIGDVLVSDWSSDDSWKVIQAARQEVGPARVSDLGSTLSGLRGTAHRKRTGGRWLSPDENPLEGVSYTQSSTIQGAAAKFVPPHLRPETENVHKAIASAREVGRWTWLGDLIEVAAFCAPRQGEQLGLRAVDVDLLDRQLDINGSWQTPPSGKRAGQGKVRVGRRTAYTKNGKRRRTPYVGSMHDMLTRAVATALGLPPQTPAHELAAAVESERARRAATTRTGDWRDARVAPADELWLFPSEDGQPPSKEQLNDAWHIVRDAVGWSKRIPYRNLRHHAICWWKEHLGLPDYVTIATWSGHDVRTLEAYYVIPSQDATAKLRNALDTL